MGYWGGGDGGGDACFGFSKTEPETRPVRVGRCCACRASGPSGLRPQIPGFGSFESFGDVFEDVAAFNSQVSARVIRVTMEVKIATILWGSTLGAGYSQS